MASARRKQVPASAGQGPRESGTRSNMVGQRTHVTTNRGSTYHDATLHLDGNVYEECIFIKCQLVYSGTGPVGLRGCTFEDCVFGFEGAAPRVVEFLNALAGDPGLRSALLYILPNLQRQETIH